MRTITITVRTVKPNLPEEIECYANLPEWMEHDIVAEYLNSLDYYLLTEYNTPSLTLKCYQCKDMYRSITIQRG